MNTMKKRMKEIDQAYFTGERPLFHEDHVSVNGTIFAEGESPLKECSDIELKGSMFKWKYPLWYSRNIVAEDCTWFEMARAGVWYSENMDIKNAVIEAPKNFRRCRSLSLSNVSFPNAAETLWSCDGVVLDHVIAKGDYCYIEKLCGILDQYGVKYEREYEDK